MTPVSHICQFCVIKKINEQHQEKSQLKNYERKKSTEIFEIGESHVFKFLHHTSRAINNNGVFRGLWIPVHAKTADIGSKSETVKPKVCASFRDFLVLGINFSVFFSNPGHVGVAEKY